MSAPQPTLIPPCGTQALVQALTHLVERTEYRYDGLVRQRSVCPLSGPDLAYVRTLTLALLCTVCDDARPGLGPRLERCLFPDDDSAAAAPADEAETEPAPFEHTAPMSYRIGGLLDHSEC
jgi:hypothetical protein